MTQTTKPAVFGTDNELMVFCGVAPMSALDTIPGRKENPTPLKMGAMQADNVNAEMNTIPATESFEQFAESWLSVVSETQEFIRRHPNGNQSAELVAIASYEFPASLLQNPEALVFGCEPDFNAYTVELNTMDPDAQKKPLRTAGAHIHIGHNDDDHPFLLTMHGRLRMAQAMDFFVGLPMVWLDNSEESVRRRQLYGGASAHRPKDYGVEYRSLSNFWTRSRKLSQLTYELTQAAVVAVGKDDPKNPLMFSLVDKVGASTMMDIINSGHTKEAERIFTDLVVPFVPDATLDLLQEMRKTDNSSVCVVRNWTS